MGILDPETSTPETSDELNTASTVTRQSDEGLGAASSASRQTAQDLNSAASASRQAAQGLGAVTSVSSATAQGLSGATSFTKVSSSIGANTPKILFDNFLLESSATDTPTITRDTYNLTTWDTDKSLTYTLPALTGIDTVALAFHNLEGATVTIRRRTTAGTGSYVTIDSRVIPNNGPIMFNFTQVNVRDLNILINGSPTDSFLGYVSAGRSLVSERPVFNGVTPFQFSDETTYYTPRSASGRILSRSIVRQQSAFDLPIRNLSKAWVFSNVPGLKVKAKTDPVFIAWNYQDFQDDIIFGMIDNNIAPVFNGVRDLMDMELSISGL